jgi:hypothetical protein
MDKAKFSAQIWGTGDRAARQPRRTRQKGSVPWAACHGRNPEGSAEGAPLVRIFIYNSCSEITRILGSEIP